MGLEKFNNQTAKKMANDPQARFGNKGKAQFWYGYKEHASVDMQSGLINKVAATPAHTRDADGLRHVCPDQGAVFADKGYCVEPAQKWTPPLTWRFLVFCDSLFLRSVSYVPAWFF